MSARKKSPRSPKKSESEDMVPATTAPSAPEVQLRPALTRALEAVRKALGALVDLADAAAEALAKR